MTQNGIKITDLRAEVQTLVNSDPTKYNPNKNNTIDDGDELSLLLSEYQCSAEDLTKKGGKTMLTNEEKLAVDKYAWDEGFNTASSSAAGVIGGLATAGFALAAGGNLFEAATEKGFFENKKITKNVDIETLVKDGSYTKDGRPAYDIRKYMKKYVSEEAFQNATFKFENGETLASWTSSVDGRFGKGVTRDIDGKPFVLRKWKPGDPQYVKTGTKTVDFMKKVMTKSGKQGLFFGGVAALLGLVSYGIVKSNMNSAANEKITAIKAEQTKVGQEIMEKRRQEEADRAAREAALKKEELEYKERLNTATSGIENNISRADKKAKSVNKELDKIKEKVTTEE